MPLQDLTPQLRTRLRRVEKMVGLFVGVATVLLLAGFVYYLYHTAARKGWFVVKVTYNSCLMSAAGLAEGDPVKMMGFTVGTLTTIEAMPPGSYYPVYIEFDIRRPYYGYIWSDSKLLITSAGFLGKRQLEIGQGYDGKPTVIDKDGRVTQLLVSGEYRPADQVASVYLDPSEAPSLTERAEKLVSQVETALPSILGLTNRVDAILSNTTTLTANAARLADNIDALVVDARPIVGEVEVVVTNLQTQLAGTFDSVNTNLQSVVDNLNLSLLNLADITSNLNVQVQSNDRILSEISDLVIETDDLLQGLKRHWLLKGAFPAADTNQPPGQILEPALSP